MHCFWKYPLSANPWGRKYILFHFWVCGIWDIRNRPKLWCYSWHFEVTKLKVKHCSITEKKKIWLVLHFRCTKPHGLVPLLQPSGCLHSVAEDSVQLKNYKAVPLRITNTSWKRKLQEKMGEITPILSLATLLFLFSTPLSLPFAACCNGLSAILSLSSKALQTHIISFLLKGLFLVSHIPLHSLICTLPLPLFISQRICWDCCQVKTRVLAECRPTYVSSLRNKQFKKSLGFSNLHRALGESIEVH